MGVMHARRRTTQEWADQNPILLRDQMAINTDTGDFRIGDGETRWSKLPVYSLRQPVNISFADLTVTQEFLESIESRLSALESIDHTRVQ